MTAEAVNDEAVDPGATAALDQALLAWRAGGLPCGAALVSQEGGVIASGRNHAYDRPTGSDRLENTPLAHAELNVLAQVPTDRDLSADVLWSTQQPCPMCEVAIRFCGVGTVRHLAADPSFLGVDDPLAPHPVDPTGEDPRATSLAILANAVFLQPFIARGLKETLERNRTLEPETTQLAEILAGVGPPDDLGGLFELVANDLPALAARRTRRRTGS